ncbi:MAG TPA: hypothetical protein VGM91_22965 [Conexibacter sp.]|jgi:membrane associated rhomboid family serine protease
MTLLRTLKKLLVGETWLLPVGLLIAIAIALGARHALHQHWQHIGGFILLAAVGVVLLVTVARTSRRR